MRTKLKPIGNLQPALQCVVACVSLMTLRGQAFAYEDRLDVFPQSVSVSADYPAHFVVVLRSEDGTMRQLKADQYQAQIENDSYANFSGGDWISAAQNGQTSLTVVRGNQTVKVPITVNQASPQSPSFPREISAVLSKSGCNLGTCHGNLHGKGGLRFSLRGDDPEFDFGSITVDQGGRRIDWIEPEQSLILRKPSGGQAHQGGIRLPRNSVAYEWIKRWIESDEGQASSMDVSAPANQIVELHVEPSRALIPTNARSMNLVVWARWADGTVRDVTRWARYEPNLTGGVSVDESGQVTAYAPVDVAIAVSYLQARSSARLTFLAHDQIAAQSHSPETQIDRLIDQQLAQLRIEPSGDAEPSRVFRRMFLVTVGRLPSSGEVREFIDDERPDRLDVWLERLLADPATARLWALRWSDVLRNEQKVMSPKGTQLLSDWLARQFSEDRPINQTVASLVSSIGSTFDNPPASFHRTHRDPTIAAESVGQVFLGVRMQCARCHNHPFDVWKQDDYYGLAAYFSTVERQQIDNKRPDDLDKHVITGDEVISLVSRPAEMMHPGRSVNVGPRPLNATQPTTPPTTMENPLKDLADWLTKDNRQFARNIANRVWFHLMGRGIVDPPDDFRVSNPASNPALLEYLTDELIQSDYSVRHLSRLILTSGAFAREPVSQIAISGELPIANEFAGYPVRRMPAELLLDAIADATGVPLSRDGGTDPSDAVTRAANSTIIPPSSSFVRAFGKPERLLDSECERSDQLSVRQSLMLLNGDDVRKRVNSRRSTVRELIDGDISNERAVEELYLATLSRLPNPTEQAELVKHLAQATDRKEAMEDVLWALINSQEFLFIN